MYQKEYKDLEQALRQEAGRVAAADKPWSAEEVSARLNEIADILTSIRKAHQGGVDASMGKRSGWNVDL